MYGALANVWGGEALVGDWAQRIRDDARGNGAVTITLSKSKFVAGCQCLKRLYLQAHEPELAAGLDATAEAIIEQGREVGILARKLFPGEVSHDPLAQITRTSQHRFNFSQFGFCVSQAFPRVHHYA